jgi:dihydrolipoamide dehydrogenase
VKEQKEVLTVRYVLVGDTRVPNVVGIGLEYSGVSLVEGCIKVNNRMETNVAGIYAAGDVIGESMLAHYAFETGRIAAENALGKQSTINRNVVPRCVYSYPEIATVGLTEEQAVAQGYQVKIGRFPFSANGLATVLGERTGFVKVVSETRYGQILGVHILGTLASELISEAVLAMRLEESPSLIGSTIHVHPTLSEALMEAMLDLSGQTIHYKSKNA